MNAEQLRGRLPTHGVRDASAPIAALRCEARVTEAAHQIERVRCARAVSRGIGERPDDLELLDNRAGPPVRDDERQRTRVPRANLDEVDVEPVNLGYELRQDVSASPSHLRQS